MIGHISANGKAPNLLKPKAQYEAGAHMALNNNSIDFKQQERPVDLSGVSVFGTKC